MPMKHWTVQDAATLYGIREWGSGYFGINAKGHLEITPTKDESLSCDVYEIIQYLKKKGIRTPVNLRFPQVLADRVIEVNESFRRAIIEFGYEGGYQGVYPVKTNQTKEVVEEIVRAAYQKFARDRLRRKAMKLSFGARSDRRSAELEGTAP